VLGNVGKPAFTEATSYIRNVVQENLTV